MNYEFSGQVVKEYLGESTQTYGDSHFFHPYLPVTRIGYGNEATSINQNLKVYFDDPDDDPLDRCVSKPDLYGSIVNDYKITATSKCLTTQRTSTEISGRTYYPYAVLQNIASGKGKRQLLLDQYGDPVNKYDGWRIESFVAGDYWVTYFTDMDTNALPVALGRGQTDTAALDLDVYTLVFPNLDCVDYESETYDEDTCIDAMANTITGNVCDDDNSLNKCIELELDPVDWQQSMGSRYFQQIDDNSIYYASDADIRNQIISAVYATRNGVVMQEKSTITEFTSPYETVFACINSCGIPQDEWRVYVDNGQGDPADHFPPTMHAFNPWSLNATSRAPTWFSDGNSDYVNDIDVDIFTVLNNIGFKSTSIALGTGDLYSGSTSSVTTNKQTAENKLFGTDQGNLDVEGLIGAYELQGSIELYLEHTLFSYWNDQELINTYNLNNQFKQLRREQFWTYDSIWNGTSSGSDANGILDFIEWMTKLAKGNYSQYGHETHGLVLKGLEFDFEPTANEGTYLGHLFFEPFYPFHERSGLLTAIEERGRQMRDTISDNYQYLTVLAYFNEEMFINPAVQAFIRGLSTRTAPDTGDMPIAGGIHIFTSSSYRVPYDSTQATWEENIRIVGKGAQTVILLNEAIDEDSHSDWDLTGGIEWGSTFVSWWDISKEDSSTMDWNDDPSIDYSKQNWLALSYDGESNSLEQYLEAQLLPYCDEHLVFPLMNFDLLWLYPKGLTGRGTQGNCNANWIDCNGDIWPWTMTEKDQADFYQLQYWNGSETCPCEGFDSGADLDLPWETKVTWQQVGLRGRWGVDTASGNASACTNAPSYDTDDFYCGGTGWEPPTATMMNGNDLDFIMDLSDWADETY